MRFRWIRKRPDLTHTLIILVVLVPLFALNGRWGAEANPDVVAVNVPAWQWSINRTIDLSGFDVITNNLEHFSRWYFERDDGKVYSNRAPGLIALAIPSYWAFGSRPFTNAPGTLIALSTTLLAIIVLWRVMRPFVGRPFATAAVITLGLGTTTWSVSSSELWPHGPGQLWSAGVLLALSYGTYLGAGAAFALGILTRPITGVFSAVTGLLEGVRKRRLAPVLQIAAVSAVGVAVLLIYNKTIFGQWSLRGGYSDQFTSGAVDRFTTSGYLLNLWQMFLGIPHGVLVTSPIVGVATFGAIRYRAKIPGWARSAAVAGVAYLVVHAALNRVSGGAIIFYRYPLEALTLAGVALAIGSKHLYDSGPTAKRAVTAAAAVSIALQFLNVFVFSCFVTDPAAQACLLAAT